MTIQIPEDLARGLKGMAAVQRKSIEEVAVESLRQLFDQQRSPEAILLAVRSLPHPSAAAVDEMEAAILSARLPVRDQGTFD
jgi:plasmid stability protein